MITLLKITGAAAHSRTTNACGGQLIAFFGSYEQIARVDTRIKNAVRRKRIRLISASPFHFVNGMVQFDAIISEVNHG